MAKRKASRRGRPASGGAPRVRRQARAPKARPVARKAVAKKRPASSPARRKAATRRTAPKGTTVRRATRASAKARAAKSRSATKATALKTRRTATPARKVVSPKIARVALPKVAKPKVPFKAAAPKPTPKVAPIRVVTAADQAKRKHVLDLDRERRRVQGDEVVSPTPPSSLHLDRTASAARSGRQELQERYDKHTETSPVMTGGDVDAAWESAYAVGDETPGSDNPTPDQNVVDDIALAVGVEYDDNEELEGAGRIEERDRHRWEFDPASSDDFDER